MQKRRQRSSLLLGGPLPRQLAPGRFEEQGANQPVFNLSWCKTASVARNLIKCCPQTEATTFAFCSVFILLWWDQTETQPKFAQFIFEKAADHRSCTVSDNIKSINNEGRTLLLGQKHSGNIFLHLQACTTYHYSPRLTLYCIVLFVYSHQMDTWIGLYIITMNA